MTDLMTVPEVANYLRVTRKTIYRLLGRGDIPATKVGHQWRFAKTAIDEWLQRQSAEAKANVLVIDDKEVIRALFKETLEELGYKVVVTKTDVEGLELVKQQSFDMVFLDLRLSGMMDGAKLFRQLKAIRHELPVTITTGYPDSDIMKRALAEGPFAVMSKPFTESDIMAALNSFPHRVG